MICLLRVGFDDAEEPDETLFAPVADRLGNYRIERRDDGSLWDRACQLLPESKNAWLGVWTADAMTEIYMKVGEPELALARLEHSVSVPAGLHVAALRVSPLWEPLRNDPRFQRLLAAYEPRD